MSNVDPDGLQRWVDLTVYDRAPEELLERALADIAAKFPDFRPLKGTTEVTLLEAFCLVVAELIYGINRVPAAVTEILLRLFGVERSNGTAAVATVEFTFIDDDGHTIDAGSRLRLDLADATTLIFTTDADATALPGETTAIVDVTATEATDAANGTVIGTPLAIVEAAPYVDGVELVAAVADGTSPEDTITYLDRAVKRFDRLTDTLVKPVHFVAAAHDDPRVVRAHAIDNHDGVDEADGHMFVAVAGAGGAALSADAKDEIEDRLNEDGYAMLVVTVGDATVTNVPGAITVKKMPGAVDLDVKNAVVAAWRGYLNADIWPWGDTVRRNELIAVSDRANLVDYVVDLALPAADVNLPGVAPLATTDITIDDVTVV